MTLILILILLNIGHFFGDFTHLSRPDMLAAKKFGTPLLPIWQHACVHGGLVLLITFLFTPTFLAACWLALYMTAMHFLIDVIKGRLNKKIPVLQDATKYWHWWAFGIDQFLHQLVLIQIAYLICQ